MGSPIGGSPFWGWVRHSPRDIGAADAANSCLYPRKGKFVTHLRPSITLSADLARQHELIDAAIAVNEAPTLDEAFQVLADAGIKILGADRLASSSGTTISSAARSAPGPASPTGRSAPTAPDEQTIAASTRASRTSGRRSGFPAGLRGMTVETVVRVPFVVRVSAPFHASWHALEDEAARRPADAHAADHARRAIAARARAGEVRLRPRRGRRWRRFSATQQASCSTPQPAGSSGSRIRTPSTSPTTTRASSTGRRSRSTPLRSPATGRSSRERPASSAFASRPPTAVRSSSMGASPPSAGAARSSSSATSPTSTARTS